MAERPRSRQSYLHFSDDIEDGHKRSRSPIWYLPDAWDSGRPRNRSQGSQPPYQPLCRTTEGQGAHGRATYICLRDMRGTTEGHGAHDRATNLCLMDMRGSTEGHGAYGRATNLCLRDMRGTTECHGACSKFSRLPPSLSHFS